VVGGFAEEEMMETTRRHRKFVHENGYAAEVEVELITTDDAWSPYLSLVDAKKLDAVRHALRQGDVRAASKLANVYRLTPVSAA
jgi:hypothetical protein